MKNKHDQDGVSTSRPGVVYDVYIRYKSDGRYKTYGKRGFTTKKEALQHEADMRIKLNSLKFTMAPESKQNIEEYMNDWIQKYGNINLRPSTLAGYKNNIKNHIIPIIGDCRRNCVNLHCQIE